MTFAPAEARTRLLALLTERSFARKKVILSSGRESDFFIDCKQTALLAEGHALLGPMMLDAALSIGVSLQGVAGVELGGCSLASAVSLASFERGVRSSRGLGLDAIYVRKQAKDHGSQRRLEGDTAFRPGDEVVIVEDVITTGGSTLRAADALTEAELRVAGVVAIVDRLEGGAEHISARGIPVVSLFTRSDFMPL